MAMFHFIKLNTEDCAHICIPLFTIGPSLKFQRSTFNRSVIKCKCLMDSQDVLHTFKTVVDC